MPDGMRDREFKITKAEEGAAFAVHVVPKAAKNEVVGKHGDALKIHLTSNTVGGIANDTLINFIAQIRSIMIAVQFDILDAGFF